MKRSTARLSRTQQLHVCVLVIALFITGAFLMRLHQDETAREPSEIIPWLLKIHGGVAMLMLIVLGSLASHIAAGWRAAKNRLSGSLLIGINAFLIATGYGLYYAGDESFREWMRRLHGWIGLSVIAVLPLHMLLGWRGSRK